MIIGLYDGLRNLDAATLVSTFQQHGVNFHLNCRTSWLQPMRDAGLYTCTKAYSSSALVPGLDYAHVAHEVQQFPLWATSIQPLPVCLYNNDYKFVDANLGKREDQVALLAINSGSADDWAPLSRDIGRYLLGFKYCVLPRVRDYWRLQVWALLNVPPGASEKRIRLPLTKLAKLGVEGLIVRPALPDGEVGEVTQEMLDALRYVSQRY